MNETDKLLLQRIAEDEKTLAALEHILLVIVKPDESRFLGLADKELGEEVRAGLRAKELIKKGIQEIRNLKISRKQTIPTNYL